MIASLYQSGSRSSCWLRRNRLNVAISGMILPGSFQFRNFSSYFSESLYSSRPGSGSDSQNSKPEYMPQDPASIVASAARMTKPGRPEFCRKYGLISGVLTKKFGRKNHERGGEVSSLI